MVVNKLPKISALTGFSLGGWLLPLALNLPLPLEGFSLALACFSSVSLAVETRRETIVSGIKETEKRLSLERVAYELALSHEKELAELRSLYGFGDSDNDDDDYQPGEQGQLTGGYMNQPTIAPGSGETPGGETDRLFRLEWLLQSNSQHALLCGDTGAGKTFLARGLLDRLDIKDVTVLDPDDDGDTWQGFKTIGTDDNWEAIREAYGSSLEEFNSRTPNDRNLTPKAYVLEELPDHLLECKNAEKVIGRILRRGRKRKVFLLAITQDQNQDAIKISAPLKKCFTTFFLQGYAQHALKHLAPKADRAVLALGLKTAKRPAIVQFKGEFFYWDVPDLSPAGGGNAPAIPLEQEENGTIAILERTINAPPIQASLLHWELHDLALAVGGELSVRQAMRSIPALKTSDQTKQMFSDLCRLELGQTRIDGARILFTPYKPIV